MFREARRKNQLLSQIETIGILKACTSGVLGVTGDAGYPYTVPISYAYQEGKLFFHCANEGHKIDGIKRNEKVSFCVIDKDEVIQKTFTTHYRSVIVFGRARILTEDRERRNALDCLVAKYSPDFINEGQQEIEKSWNRVCVVEIIIEHMTGKAAIEIINNPIALR
jgi:nitroimidazol reductase NimA-like FMN-containing flavoprotein (pyridoxamine 5'-phosphate oxidase superfamily)